MPRLVLLSAQPHCASVELRLRPRRRRGPATPLPPALLRSDAKGIGINPAVPGTRPLQLVPERRRNRPVRSRPVRAGTNRLLRPGLKIGGATLYRPPPPNRLDADDAVAVTVPILASSTPGPESPPSSARWHGRKSAPILRRRARFRSDHPLSLGVGDGAAALRPLSQPCRF